MNKFSNYNKIKSYFLNNNQGNSESSNEEDLSVIAEQLASIQFLDIPAPTKQRKYILSTPLPESTPFITRISKFLLLPLALGSLALVAFKGYEKTEKSLPGSNLYTIKKISEKAQIASVADNPEKLAEAQLELTLKRIDEAKQIINSPTSTGESKKVAIEAVTEQANKAIPALKSNENFKPDKLQGSQILENLSSLKSDLIKTPSIADSSVENTELAKSTEDANSATSELFKIVTASLLDETVLTDNSKSDVHVTGRISKITENSITVENTTFTFDPQVLIIQKAVEEGKFNPGKITDLYPRIKVTVDGQKTDSDSLKATKVTILLKLEKAVPVTKPAEPEETTPEPEKNELKAVLIIENPKASSQAK